MAFMHVGGVGGKAETYGFGFLAFMHRRNRMCGFSFGPSGPLSFRLGSLISLGLPLTIGLWA